MSNVLYITRSIDVLAAEVRKEAYDRLRFYLPMLTRLAELSGGDVYVQTKNKIWNNPKTGGALWRMKNRTGKSVKAYDPTKIDYIMCAIFCPDHEDPEEKGFFEDLAKFEQTLEETGAPYFYHDSDKEFSTSNGSDLFHVEKSSTYFLQHVAKLPADHILRTRLKGVYTSVPDPKYYEVLRQNFPDITVAYYPAVFWSDWKTQYQYVPAADRLYDVSFLRSFYLDKSKSLFVRHWGTEPVSVLLGSRFGTHTGNTHLLKGASIHFDTFKQGATYGELSEYMSKSRLTPSSSIYERVTSKLFEAAESRTLAILIDSCFTSSEVTHPKDALEQYVRLPRIANGDAEQSVTKWATKLRNMSDAEYQDLLAAQDKLIDLCFSIDGEYITNLTQSIVDLMRK